MPIFQLSAASLSRHQQRFTYRMEVKSQSKFGSRRGAVEVLRHIRHRVLVTSVHEHCIPNPSSTKRRFLDWLQLQAPGRDRRLETRVQPSERETFPPIPHKDIRPQPLSGLIGGGQSRAVVGMWVTTSCLRPGRCIRYSFFVTF